MQTIHVVDGPVAAGTLAAVLTGVADARVLHFVDPLSVGPLDDVDTTGQRRAAFWRGIHEGMPADWPPVRSGDERAWAELQAAAGRVVVWHGAHPAEVLLMLRLASRFHGWGRELHEVVRPRSRRRRPAFYDSVGISDVDDLSPLVHKHSVVDVARRADEWAAARDAPNVCFRELAAGGTIVGLPESGRAGRDRGARAAEAGGAHGRVLTITRMRGNSVKSTGERRGPCR